MIFPVEIWEHIFLHTDPITLIRFKLVSKCWKEIIEKILKEHNHWQIKCKTDIPEYHWGSLLEKLYPTKFYNLNEVNKNSEIWMQMYKLWIKCKNWVNCNTVIDHLQPLPKHRPTEKVTCAALLQNILAVGTSKGHIYFYELSNLNGLPIYVADHRDFVCDIQFLFSEEKKSLIAISVSLNQWAKWWDIELRMLIVLTPAKYICTSYNYYYDARKNLLREGLEPTPLFLLPTVDIVALVADNNKVSVYSKDGHYVKLNLSSKEPEFDQPRISQPCIVNEFIEPPNHIIRRYFMFKGEVIACITELGYLGLSVRGKEWRIHNLFPIFHAIPTTVLVFTHLLILGLDTGTVIICYVEDFETLNFETLSLSNIRNIILDTLPIVSLSIMVSFDKEYLMVADDKSIYLIKFI